MKPPPHRPGNNVAVFEYKNADGTYSTIVMRNKPKGKHSEELIRDELVKRNVDPDSVSRIYSERIPCSTPRHECGILVGQYRNAELTYSWADSDAAKRGLGDAMGF